MSVKQLWPLENTDEDILKYFPSYLQGKLPSAKFFYGIGRLLMMLYDRFCQLSDQDFYQIQSKNAWIKEMSCKMTEKTKTTSK